MPYARTDQVTASATPGRGLRVAYVLGAFPVLSETFIANEVRAMRAEGHDVLPITLSRTDLPCQEEDVGFRAERVEVHGIALAAAAGAILRAAARPARLLGALRFARAQTGLPAKSLLLAGARIAAAATAGRVSHIHAHYAHGSAAHAIVAARLAGLTCSFTAHGGDVNVDPVDLPLKIVSVDAAIGVCEDMARRFRVMAQAVGHDGRNIHVLPCGVDPARFRPDAQAGNGRLLSIGRLMPVKGYHVLIRALAALPADRRPVVDVIGTGPMEAELKDMARDLGVADCITFLGARHAAWIAANGPGYTGFVAPYVRAPNGDCDQSPQAVKEAMAMQLPVVGSDLPGMVEIVTPECGKLVEMGNAEAMAGALAWLGSLDADSRASLGAAGRARVLAHFTLKGQATGLAAIIAGCARH